MNAYDFAYWLRGLFEVAQPTALDAAQTRLVREHLDKVFAPKEPAPTRDRTCPHHRLIC